MQYTVTAAHTLDKTNRCPDSHIRNQPGRRSVACPPPKSLGTPNGCPSVGGITYHAPWGPNVSRLPSNEMLQSIPLAPLSKEWAHSWHERASCLRPNFSSTTAF